MSNSSMVQLTLNNVLGNDDEQTYFNKKLEELIINNDNQAVIDISYVLSVNIVFINIAEKFLYIEKIRSKNKSYYERYYDYWCFVLNFIPSNFHKGMTEALLRQNRTLSLIDANRTKKRWINTSLKTLKDGADKLSNKRYNECKEDYFLKKGKIQQEYGVDHPDNFIEHEEEWFSQWIDKDRLLVEYPYLSELTDKKINRAFEIDLHNCITAIIMEEYNYNIDSIQTKRPEELLTSGIFSSTPRSKMDFTAEEIDGNNVLVSKLEHNNINEGGVSNAVLSFNPQNIQITDEDLLNNGFLDFIISNTISPDALRKMNNNATIKRKLYSNLTLDQYDIKILELILNRVEGPTVRIYHKEFLKYLCLSRSSYNYKLIDGKLRKFPGYVYSGEFANSGTTTMNFISSVNTFEDEFGEVYSDITVGQNLYISITKGRVMQLYTRELNKLKLLLTQTLAYMFVMERNKYTNMGDDVANKEYTYSVDFIKQYIYLDKKNKIKKNMDILEEGIKELCDNKFILKSYERGKDYFKVRYFPDTEDKKNILNATSTYLPEYIKE